MLTFKQLVTILAISTVGSRCAVALPQNSELENPMLSVDLMAPHQDIRTPNVPQIDSSDAQQLPHADEDDENNESDLLDVSGVKRFGVGYPHWGGRKGLRGYGGWGYSGWSFGKKGFPYGGEYGRLGKEGPYGRFHGRFGKKGLPYGGFYGKKDAEVAEMDVPQTEDMNALEEIQEMSVSGFKGGWGYGYGAYPLFGRKKGHRRFGWGGRGKEGFGKKRFGGWGWY